MKYIRKSNGNTPIIATLMHSYGIMAVMKCFDLAGTWVVDPILIGRVNTNAAG